MHKIQELLKPWGIEVSAQTRAEAQEGAKHQDNDWEGYQYTGQYEDEFDENALFLPDMGIELPDPHNGHRH